MGGLVTNDLKNKLDKIQRLSQTGKAPEAVEESKPSVAQQSDLDPEGASKTITPLAYVKYDEES